MRLTPWLGGASPRRVQLARFVRTARRRLGCSQRGLADRLDVSSSTVARWETGAGAPTAAQLQRLLVLVGLQLHVEPAADQQQRDAPLIRHLHLSLTQRLRPALGDALAVVARATSPAWQDLLALAPVARVELAPPLADALWLPTGFVTAVRVTLYDLVVPRIELPAVRTVEVSHCATAAPASLIPVTLQGNRRVWGRPPLELVAADARSSRLRQADKLLHDFATRDHRGRRRPAHRDPDEQAEHGRLLRTNGADPWAVDPRQSRGWRLGGRGESGAAASRAVTG